MQGLRDHVLSECLLSATLRLVTVAGDRVNRDPSGCVCVCVCARSRDRARERAVAGTRGVSAGGS
eukprot:7391750-Prymnesium_polylepis.2